MPAENLNRAPEQQPSQTADPREQLLGPEVNQAIAKAVQSAATRSETLNQDLQAALVIMGNPIDSINPEAVKAFNRQALSNDDPKSREKARETGLALNTLLACEESFNYRA